MTYLAYQRRMCYARFLAIAYVWRTMSICGVLRVSMRLFVFIMSLDMLI